MYHFTYEDIERDRIFIVEADNEEDFVVWEKGDGVIFYVEFDCLPVHIKSEILKSIKDHFFLEEASDQWSKGLIETMVESNRELVRWINKKGD